MKLVKKILSIGCVITSIMGETSNVSSTSTASALEGKLDKDAEKQLIQSIQTYLNSLRSIQSRFIQTNPASTTLRQGSLKLYRGGKLRIEYDLPFGLIMVGNGGELRYYDPKMDKINSTQIDSTPLGTLLSHHVNFDKDMKVLDVRKSAGMIRMLVTKEGFGNGGYLVLVFSDYPIKLRQWVVMDDKRNQINFSLIDPMYNETIDDKYFDVNSVKRRM